MDIDILAFLFMDIDMTFFDSSKSGEKSMSAANKYKTTAWASGRTWCVAQVVVIDGITAWKVYDIEISKITTKLRKPYERSKVGRYIGIRTKVTCLFHIINQNGCLK